MKILLTGSSGHLGDALLRILRADGHELVGLDVAAGPGTSLVGSIVDPDVVANAMRGVEAVLHTATLHKPHVATHSRRDFVDTNVVGTLNLLEAAAAARCESFIYASTTSVFGRASTPAKNEPTAWITEDVAPRPKNIYGVTKNSAEDLCELFHRKFALPCVVLRIARFFPDEDDDAEVRRAYGDDNIKVNEYLYRRIDIEDVVTAHVRALKRAAIIGFGRYIISSTTPFAAEDAENLRARAPDVVARLLPEYQQEYARRGWRMFPGLDRVYVNNRARRDLEWEPRWTFGYILERLRSGEDFRSDLARSVGFKGYHAGRFHGEMYPTD